MGGGGRGWGIKSKKSVRKGGVKIIFEQPLSILIS